MLYHHLLFTCVISNVHIVLPIKEEQSHDFIAPQDKMESNIDDLIQEEIPKELCMESLKLAFEFLGPQEMRSMSLTCKELKEYLNYEMVIRSCMLSGGYCLETMKILKDCCEHASIFPMTPSVLLAASLERQCAICKTAAIHHVRKFTFLPICFNCTKISGSVDKLSKDEELFWLNPVPGMAVLHNKRFHAKWYGKRNARSHWHYQMREAQRLDLTYYTHSPIQNDTDDHRDSFFYQGHSQVLKIQDKEAYTNANHWTDGNGNRFGNIFTSKLLRGSMEKKAQYPLLKVEDILQESVSLVGAPEEGHHFYQTCIELFEEYKDQAILRVENRIAERGMANDNYTCKRIVSCQRMINKMVKHMDNPNSSHLLSHRINKNYSNAYLRKKFKQQPLKFSIYWVDEYMRANAIMKAPSKICIKKVVDELRQLDKVKTSETDRARLRENYKTLLKYYYKSADGNTVIYRCHGN